MATTAILEYDIIFAGGGATACVTAGRLASADPTLRILVLEAGPHTKGQQNYVQPARYARNLVPGSPCFSFMVGSASEATAGRPSIVPVGKCVGGGSSVHFMMYTRPPLSDFDDWKSLGNTGWSSQELLPLLQKSETYQVRENQPHHGYDGPIKVSYGGFFSNLGKQFLEVAGKYDTVRAQDIEADVNDRVNVYGRWPKWIDGQRGTRQDTAHAYLYESQYSNVDILDASLVKRVIFNETTAVGVDFLQTVGTNVVEKTALAKKQVVISAGAFGTPSILERSGVGASDILTKFNIPQISDLPGVGENYADHDFVAVPFLAKDNAQTLDGIFSNDTGEVERSVAEWKKTGKGAMASNGIDVGIRSRLDSVDLQGLPTFGPRYESFFASSPDKPATVFGVISGGLMSVNPETPRRKYFHLAYFNPYPVSTGSVHIASDNVNASPEFASGQLTNPVDLEILRWTYKKTREIARRMPLFDGEIPIGHPTFSEASSAVTAETDAVDVSSTDIVYTAEDDAAIDAYHRKTVQTTFHSMGTCAMKPRSMGGVVDPRLNVYGTQRLKVADLSIVPAHFGANTYSAALCIGEKAALIIAEDLGIQGV